MVDRSCRVRGVEDLRVVGASVMPDIVRANTNLTCIMIGERVADWMRAEAWRTDSESPRRRGASAETSLNEFSAERELPEAHALLQVRVRKSWWDEILRTVHRSVRARLP